MAIDILYVSFNRLEFTKATFTALVENTDWTEIGGLYLADDHSSDGTIEWLADAALDRVPRHVPVHELVMDHRGPVAAMNRYLDVGDPTTGMFAKIDNDTIVPPGWLNELYRIMFLNPQLDILGMAPRQGPPVAGECPHRSYTDARHIGGVGLLRRRAFDQCRPVPRAGDGRHGFTDWQEQHERLKIGWATPDLASFQLDQLPLEPWQTLSAGYVAEGWQRRWDPFSDDATAYWEWWTARHPR